MRKAMKRISRSEKPFRELPDGARQRVETLNSPWSSGIEGHGIFYFSKEENESVCIDVGGNSRYRNNECICRGICG